MTRTDTIVAAATPPGRGERGHRARLGAQDTGDCRGDSGRAAAAAARDLCSRFSTASSNLSMRAWRCSFRLLIPIRASTSWSCRATAGLLLSRPSWRAVLELGARRALPGEFTQRAFLNDKLDLAQAEAIADLIDAGSREAARAADALAAGRVLGDGPGAHGSRDRAAHLRRGRHRFSGGGDRLSRGPAARSQARRRCAIISMRSSRALDRGGCCARA